MNLTSHTAPTGQSSHTEEGKVSRAERGGGKPALHFYSTFPSTPVKAVVALVHGYADYGGRYAHVAEAWAERGIATIAIDLRGHGRSDGMRGYCNRFDEYLDDVSELVALVRRRAASVPAILFGHSFGGLVAASSALVDQSPWRGLSVTKWVAGQIASRVWPSLSLASGLNGADIIRDGVRARAYDADPLVFGKANVRWFTEAQAAQASALARAPSLTLPLYVVGGSGDRLAEIEQEKAFFDRAGSKDKTLDVIDGGFHEILNEPDWRPTVDAIAAWILAHAGAGALEKR